MKKKIVICLNPFLSHFYPTLRFAKVLINEGYEVVYLCDDIIAENVKKEGFKCLVFNSYNLSELSRFKKNHMFKEAARIYKIIHSEILDLIKSSNASLVFFGISRFSLYFLPVYYSRCKMMMYSLCPGVVGASIKHLPNTSSYVPNNNLLKCLVATFTWLRRFVRIELNYSAIISNFFYPWSDIFRLSRKNKVKFGLDGYFINIPTIIFGPSQLEFEENKNALFAGLSVDESRVNKENVEIPNKKTTFYCSLGTMSYRNKKAKAFYNALLTVFKKNPQWSLLLSLGKVWEKDNTIRVTGNITVVDSCFQLNAIKNADIVITHGGFGTIKECVYYSKPMLVLYGSYDQNGNAARVAFHNIGVKSSLLKRKFYERFFGIRTYNITPETIEKLLMKSLDKKYKENIVKMHRKIFDDTSEEHLIFTIRKILEN